MRRRPWSGQKKLSSLNLRTSDLPATKIGLVLSGGGARAAYQVGALKALIPYLNTPQSPISVVVGSSIGAVNGIVLGACLKNGLTDAVTQLELMWEERTFRNTFKGSPSRAFFNAIKMASMQYASPGPNKTDLSIFDPTPLMKRVDEVIDSRGGLRPEERDPKLEAVGVMTTIEGEQRKPLLFVSSHKRVDSELLLGASFDMCYVDTLSAKHGFASAALPSVLPPVELDTEHGKVRLVDGGISQNVPVDPAARLGATKVVIIDISGRHWWHDHYGEAHDTRPTWEVAAGSATFCFRPPETFYLRPPKGLGSILKESVASSTVRFIRSLGPVWPVFALLKKKLGEEVAYEAMSYVALDSEYLRGLIERGYEDTIAVLKRNHAGLRFENSASYDDLRERGAA